MNWQQNDCGYWCDPYAVKLRQGRWVAQRHSGLRFPEHLGTFKTSQEAKEACEKARG